MPQGISADLIATIEGFSMPTSTPSPSRAKTVPSRRWPRALDRSVIPITNPEARWRWRSTSSPARQHGRGRPQSVVRDDGSQVFPG